MIALFRSVYFRAVAASRAGKVVRPELRLQKKAWGWFQKHPAGRPDEMHVHSFRDKNFPREQNLIMQRTWWHGTTCDPQPVHNLIQSFQVELSLNAIQWGTAARGHHIIGICTKRRGKQELE